MNQSRGGGRGRGGGGGGMSQNKITLPADIPLYPPSTNPAPLTLKLNQHVPRYNQLVSQVLSNYSVKPARCDGLQDGFQIERYSDRYKSPSELDPLLVYYIDPRRIPTELTSAKKKVKIVKPKANTVELKAKMALEKLKAMRDDDQEVEDDDDEPAKKRIKIEIDDTEPGDGEEGDDERKSNRDIDEDEEDIDDELDEGNDYGLSHFDNGEGYGDSDEDNLEDSYV